MVQDQTKRIMAKAIYEARLEKGWSREELAKKVHAHVTSVSAWENGTSIPHERKRILLSELLNIDIVDVTRLQEHNCGCNTKISHIQSDEKPHKMIEVLSDIFGNALSSIKVIRRNNINEYKRKQLKPYFETLYNNIINHGITYDTIEIIHEKSRVREIISNIICLSEYNYFIKVFPGEPLHKDMPALDIFLCDDARMVISGYSPSMNVHEKPKLIIENDEVAEFMLTYWNELWNRALPLNYLGAEDLTAIHKIAMDYGMAEADFNLAVEEGQEAKAKKQANYLL